MARNNPESEDDFLRMQQEAIRRVREMQSRARATLEQNGVHIENNGDMPAEPPQQSYTAPVPTQRRYTEPPRRQPEPQQRRSEPEQKQPEPREKLPHTEEQFHNSTSKSPETGKKNQAFNLSLDNDQLMLLGLIYVLMKDGADKWLILSLAYVLM